MAPPLQTPPPTLTEEDEVLFDNLAALILQLFLVLC